MTSKKTYNKLHDREFAEAYSYKTTAIGNKEHKEAMYEFAKELNKTEKTEKQKPHKIKKLEKRFIKESDFAFIIADRTRNGQLKNINNEKLVTFENLYIRRIEKLDELAIAYFNIIENESNPHPNYDKFIDYSFVVLDALELEIAKRSRTREDN